jgi:hypothetical protein
VDSAVEWVVGSVVEQPPHSVAEPVVDSAVAQAVVECAAVAVGTAADAGKR